MDKIGDAYREGYRNGKASKQKQIAELKELLMKYHDYDLTRKKPMDINVRDRAKHLLEQGE